jgi:hypothetical protein
LCYSLGIRGVKVKENILVLDLYLFSRSNILYLAPYIIFHATAF